MDTYLVMDLRDTEEGYRWYSTLFDKVLRNTPMFIQFDESNTTPSTPVFFIKLTPYRMGHNVILNWQPEPILTTHEEVKLIQAHPVHGVQWHVCSLPVVVNMFYSAFGMPGYHVDAQATPDAEIDWVPEPGADTTVTIDWLSRYTELRDSLAGISNPRTGEPSEQRTETTGSTDQRETSMGLNEYSDRTRGF